MNKSLKIGITVLDNFESIGFQIFDSLCAHYQNLSKNNNFKSNVTLTCNPDGTEDRQILFAHRPKSLDSVNLDNYHAVFFCHSGESIEACNNTMFAAMSRHPRVYLVSNGQCYPEAGP